MWSRWALGEIVLAKVQLLVMVMVAMGTMETWAMVVLQVMVEMQGLEEDFDKFSLIGFNTMLCLNISLYTSHLSSLTQRSIYVSVIVHIYVTISV